MSSSKGYTLIRPKWSRITPWPEAYLGDNAPLPTEYTGSNFLVCVDRQVFQAIWSNANKKWRISNNQSIDISSGYWCRFPEEEPTSGIKEAFLDIQANSIQDQTIVLSGIYGLVQAEFKGEKTFAQWVDIFGRAYPETSFPNLAGWVIALPEKLVSMNSKITGTKNPLWL